MKRNKGGRPRKTRGPRKRVGHWISVDLETYRRIEAAATTRGLAPGKFVDLVCAGVSIESANLLDRLTCEDNGVMCADCVAEEAGF